MKVRLKPKWPGLFAGCIILVAVGFFILMGLKIVAPVTPRHTESRATTSSNRKTVIKVNPSIGRIQRVVTHNPRIPYQLRHVKRDYWSSLKAKPYSLMDDVISDDYDRYTTYAVFKVIYGSKRTLAEVYPYGHDGTDTAFAPSSAWQPSEDAECMYVEWSNLKKSQPIIRQKHLSRDPIYLNSYDGWGNSDGFTAMRMWAAVPQSKLNVENRDVTPWLWQQLYAVQEATNYRGHTYYQVANRQGKVLGWIRKGKQITHGKYVNPVTQFLRVKTTETMRVQREKRATEHDGAYYTQKVYTVFNWRHELVRVMTISYSNVVTLFNVHQGKIVQVTLYDTGFKQVKQVAQAKGITRRVSHDSEHDSKQTYQAGEREITFPRQKYLFTMYDGDWMGDETTYGVIHVTRDGRAVMSVNIVPQME